jgi:multidrug efflux pump subunit AcrB
MLTYQPEQPNTAYGQLIVRTESRDRIDALAAELRGELGEAFPAGEIRTRRLEFGPPSGAKIEARFSGNDPEILRQLGNRAEQIMRDHPGAMDIRQDWRQPSLVIHPSFNEERARVAGVTRNDLSRAMAFATSGVRAGTFREGEEFIPIVLRPPADERLDVARLPERMVWSRSEQQYVPVTQIVDDFESTAEETLIRRRDRSRTLTVQSEPLPDLTAMEVWSELRPRIEAIELPPGYGLEWGGEYEASGEAQASLGAQLPLSFLVMLVISILLFSRVRQPLIIWLVVPMSVCGVVAGLLLSGLPFSFTALLGFLSLSGMLMKNAIVLVDEIDEQIREGKPGYPAILDASVSRLRPVFLAAATTILGMIPLIADAFFASMAVTIMGGLAFASILTLVAVPTFYASFFRIRPADPR